MRGNGHFARFFVLQRQRQSVRRREDRKAKTKSGGAAVTEKQIAAFVETTRSLGTTLCEAEGLELVHVEYQREPAGRVLRLYIDKPGGVTLDDCVAVSRQMGDLLDINLDEQLPYRLEVSSPGEQRPLGRREDFTRFAGKRVEIRVHRPVDDRRKFKGMLLGMEGDTVNMLVDGNPVAIPFGDIVRARLGKQTETNTDVHHRH